MGDVRYIGRPGMEVIGRMWSIYVIPTLSLWLAWALGLGIGVYEYQCQARCLPMHAENRIRRSHTAPEGCVSSLSQYRKHCSIVLDLCIGERRR